MKAPAGRAYFDFFGENLFRSDLSISVGELGSLLDHSGPIGASENMPLKYSALIVPIMLPTVLLPLTE